MYVNVYVTKVITAVQSQLSFSTFSKVEHSLYSVDPAYHQPCVIQLILSKRATGKYDYIELVTATTMLINTMAISQ